MRYVDRQDYGPPHADLEPLAHGTDLATDYATQLTAAPNGGQFQAAQQQIAGEHSIAWFEPGHDWTEAVPIQIFFGLVTVLAVPCFILRLLMRLGWLRTARARISPPASERHQKLSPSGVGQKNLPRGSPLNPLHTILRNRRP